MDQMKVNDNEKQLSQTEYIYFRNVFQQLEYEFSDEKDRALYVRNVFAGMSGHELEISCHSRLSLTVEQLLTLGNPVQILKFFLALSKHFLHLSTHSSGSHILQLLLEVSLMHITNDDESKEKYVVSRNMLSKLVRKYCRVVCKNTEVLLKDARACHVISTLLETLSGCKALKSSADNNKAKMLDGKVKKKRNIIESVEVPEKFVCARNKLIQCLLKDNYRHFGEISKESYTSIFHTVLLVLSRCDPPACQQLIGDMMTILFDEKLDAISDCSYSPLIEKILELCSPVQYSTIWKAHFKGRLKKYLLHPIANYVGQHLIKHCPTKAEFEEIFEETASVWDEIFNLHYLGVLVSLSEACVKLNCCQAKFMDYLANLLHCSNPIERKLVIVPLTAKCIRYNELKQASTNHKINYHGSLLIQQMFNFQKPRALVESLLNMDFTEMTSLFCNQIGSHVLDAFASSTTVGIKNKQRFINKLKENLASLACDKYASFCLEKLWKSVDMKTKVLIMNHLIKHGKKMENDKFGRIIHSSFGVSLFTHRQEDWEQWQMKDGKKRKMFQDILPAKKQKRH